ncbi:NAD(P)H-binding protein [Nesterenkonia populi]|uniref:NAD(P)H-binding protein n=1 Tax=Nesterenkonia populi TaxID=1591087 RepID=UPI0011BE7FD6|nr:NAD(P)H-binding protein [Nesterenkonia populi]
MSKIIIIGGHGRVALRLATQLAKRGDEVTGVFRNPDHESEVAETGAQAQLGDIESMDFQEITELLRGQDAVVWAAGAGGGSAQRTYAVDRDAAIRTMDAAQAAGVNRFVLVSYLRARPGHGVAPDEAFYPYIEAKKAAEEHLRATELDYTILAPDYLTSDAPTGMIDLILFPAQETYVSRGDAAAVAATVLAQTSAQRRTISFRSGDTPIAEAISD